MPTIADTGEGGFDPGRALQPEYSFSVPNSTREQRTGNAFDVGFTLRPPATGAERQVQLRFGPHLPPVPLRLEADASAFTVTEPPLGGSEGAEVYIVPSVAGGK